MSKKRPASDIGSDRLAALSAAIQVGSDDIEVGNYDHVDEPAIWVEEIAKSVTNQSVA